MTTVEGTFVRWLRLIALMTALAMPSLLGKKDIRWYEEMYGAADIQSEQVQRAHSVFGRVSAAADRSGSRYPELLVLRGGQWPIAAALQDGGIVVNLRALDVCYSSLQSQKGDDRLAFVLAHELAHLVLDSVGAQFASVDALRRPDFEDQADRQGLLFMTMAGFRPESLLEGRRTLFQDWLDASSEVPDNAASRAAAFKKQLDDFSKALPLFDSGVLLYHTGHYPEAIDLFKQFREQFPSREVFHNQALGYMQQALGVLALCDGSLVVRFSLPVQADPWTLAQRSRFRGPSQDCLQAPRFVQLANAAEEFLNQAIDRDASYLPARVHLATLRVLRNDFTGAMAEAHRALDLAQDDPSAVNVWAVSSFLWAKDMPEWQEKARQSLKELHMRQPDFLPAIFNLARIQSLSGNPQVARRLWKAYLNASPPDEMAKAAAEELGQEWPGTRRRPTRTPQPPLPLGIPDPSIQAKLRKGNLLHGPGSIEIRQLDRMRIIRINRSIEVVEIFKEAENEKASLDGLAVIQGALPSFSIRLQAEGLALKVIGERVYSRIYFRPPQP